jgi:hypothetical protein
MADLDTKMTHKMKEVEMMYDEVDAGFSKNARNRSDYLNHFDRMSNLAESSIVNFKEQLMEHAQKLERLSTCIISIVNEEEAAAIRFHNHQMMLAPGSQFVNMDEQTIRVNIP